MNEKQEKGGIKGQNKGEDTSKMLTTQDKHNHTIEVIHTLTFTHLNDRLNY